MKIHKLSAYGLGAFVLTFGATFAFGQARVPFTRPPYITTAGNITTSGNVSIGGNLSIGSGGNTRTCLNAPTCSTYLDYTQSTNNFAIFHQNAAQISSNSTNLIQFWNDVQLQARVTSAVASGNDAYRCTNVGCRLSLGNTARYLDDNGSRLNASSTFGASDFTSNTFNTLQLTGNREDSAFSVGVFIRNSFALTTEGAKLVSFRNPNTEVAFIDKDGDFSAPTYTATATSGSSFTGGNSSAPLLISSNTTDAITTTATAAIELQAAQNIDDLDALFNLKRSNGDVRFQVRENGRVVVYDELRVQNMLTDGFQSMIITGRISDGATAEAIQLRSGQNLTTAGAKIVSVKNNTSTEVASIDKDGLLRVNASNAAKPTCNATNRGRVFYLDGAAGVADTYEICMKNAADAYAWKTIVTP